MKKNNNEESTQYTQMDDVALIYEQYRPKLHGFIGKRVQSKEETEDILQEVFYKLLKNDPLENPIEHISSWLYRVATNLIVDRSRKKKEQAIPEMQDDEDNYFLNTLSNILSDDSDDPEVILQNVLIMEEINDALQELSSEQRSVFELTEFDGLSYKEIAESTGISVATLLSRKHYAVNHLRKRLYNLYIDTFEK